MRRGGAVNALFAEDSGKTNGLTGCIGPCGGGTIPGGIPGIGPTGGVPCNANSPIVIGEVGGAIG